MIMTDKRYISDFVGAETPWVGYVQPRDVFSDNGKEFANDVVEGIMRAAGITFNRPPGGQSEATYVYRDTVLCDQASRTLFEWETSMQSHA